MGSIFENVLVFSCTTGTPVNYRYGNKEAAVYLCLGIHTNSFLKSIAHKFPPRIVWTVLKEKGNTLDVLNWVGDKSTSHVFSFCFVLQKFVGTNLFVIFRCFLYVYPDFTRQRKLGILSRRKFLSSKVNLHIRRARVRFEVRVSFSAYYSLSSAHSLTHLLIHLHASFLMILAMHAQYLF